MTQIGWHPHPDRPGMHRYWDGTAWSGTATAAEMAEIGGAGPGGDPTVLRRTGEGPQCPHCGGRQFKARRTAGDRGRIAAGWFTTGVGAFTAARKRQPKVQCVTCGRYYNRVL